MRCHLLTIWCLLMPGLRLCAYGLAHPLGFASDRKTASSGQHTISRYILGFDSLNDHAGIPEQEQLPKQDAVSAAHSGRPIVLRKLQQQGMDPAVRTVVETPQEFLDAVEQGALNIELRANLDMTTVKPRGTGEQASLLNINSTTPIVASSIRNHRRTCIQGNCKTHPYKDGLPLFSLPDANWRPGMCGVITNTQFLTVRQNMWLDNLHILYNQTTEYKTSSILACEEECNLWMTMVQLTDNSTSDIGEELVGGLHVARGNLFAEDLYIMNFENSESALRIEVNSTVNLEGCTLTGNDMSPPAGSNDSAVISISGGNNVVTLRQAEISRNSAQHAIMVADSNTAEVFSDDPQDVYYISPDTELNSTATLSRVPDGRNGIDMQSEWFRDMRSSVRRGNSDKKGEDENGTEWWPVILGAGAAALFCLTASTAAVLICLRHCRRRSELKHTASLASLEGVRSHRNILAEEYESYSTHSTRTTPQHLQELQHQNEKLQLQLQQQLQLRQQEEEGWSSGLIRSRGWSQAGSRSQSYTNGASTSQSRSQGGNGGVSSMPTTIEIEQDTFDIPATVAVPLSPPGKSASTDEKVDFVQQQLDGFGLDVPVLGDLLMLGHGDCQRRHGGQSVVQMAVSKRTRMDYAIKFFLSRAAFQEEHALYCTGSGPLGNTLTQFLPKVLAAHANDDGSLVDMDGHPLPPCIVMERGTSLDMWAQSGKPDRFQAATVMSQVAVRLKDLHELGYVHRDLKPGNIMWLPRENRWTLIDFGCVAKTGENAKLGFSLAYAAPEVVTAYRRGDKCMVASEAVDAWSLGVMAFELLTGKQALPMVLGKEQVMNRLQGVGSLQLPWEGDNLSACNRRKLGVFKASILSLLQRDPVHRPSMEDFCETCNQVLAGVSSVQL